MSNKDLYQTHNKFRIILFRMNKSLLKFFQTLALNRKLLSDIKINLVHSDGFKIGELYNQIDSEAKGFIQPNDLYIYLTKKKIKVSEPQLFSIFKQLDSKKKGTITVRSLADYFSENCPSTASKKEILIHDKEEEADLIRKFFEQIISNHKRLQQVKVELTKYSAQSLFKMLDAKNDGILTLESVKTFLQRQQAPSDTIIDVFYHLGEKGIMVINYDIFQNMIQPFKRDTQIPATLLSIKQRTEPVEMDAGFTRSSSIPQIKHQQKQKFDLQDFLNLKAKQNMERREYILQHERSRTQLMDQIQKRKLNSQTQQTLNKSPSQIYTNSIYKLHSFGNDEKQENKYQKINIVPSFGVPNRSYQNKELERNLMLNEGVKRSKISPSNMSFNISESVPNYPLQDLNSILLKQREQLQFQRARRIEVENQMQDCRRQLKELAYRAEEPPFVFRPLHNIDSRIHTMNGSGQQWQSDKLSWLLGRGSSSLCRRSGGNRYQCRGARRSVERIEHQLRKKRLDREFKAFKVNKEMNQKRHLLR